MIAEPTAATYSDTDIKGYIETYPIMDENGEEPREPDDDTGLMAANTDWVSAYDLAAAAAAIWSEKGAAVAARNDFSADGGSYTLSQQYEQAMKMARYYQSRRTAKSLRLWPTPRPIDRDSEVEV